MTADEAVELMPKGKARLRLAEGGVALDIPKVLRAPWSLLVADLREVIWFSQTRAAFRATIDGSAPEPSDRSRAEVDLCGGSPTVYLRFRTPLAVPFENGRRLWPRAVLMWQLPNPSSPRIFYPPEPVRKGLASSLVMRAVGEPLLLKRLFESAGVVFPTYGDPPTGSDLP